ncbi:MAG: hydrogenase [Candidatus Schekmanbacteria bacterium]|nr:hydrogenase [Candidatus Schekmanbacteria bacterium]
MTLWLDTLLILVFLTNLRLLGSSRLGASVRVVALQGVVLGLLALASRGGDLTGHVLFLAAVSMALKGVVFPRLLFRALREARVRREVEPFVGYTSSLLVGAAMLGLSLWVGTRLPLPTAVASPVVVPVALFTILSGLFLIVSRKKALTQVLGYLVLENGIYIFGVALAQEAPLIVELGVLLDVFVAVFVMGITMFHINREFDDLDTEQMASLKD